MYKSHRLLRILAASSLTLLSACGQSGALYLPQQEQVDNQQAETPLHAKETANDNAETSPQQ